MVTKVMSKDRAMDSAQKDMVPLKPKVRTIQVDGEVEYIKVSRGLPCRVCLGAMEVGDTALRCKCRLISHKECAHQMKRCPQCGTVYDLKSEITVSEKEAKTVSKPVIRKEIKYEIEELLTVPEWAYFCHVPTPKVDGDVERFVEDFIKYRRVGELKLNKNILNKIKYFMTVDALKKMMKHCYLHGQKNEVMGLILGQTYICRYKIISVALDVATSELRASDAEVRFNSFERLFAELEELKYDYQILGWYHSHPGYTSFMSPTDIDTQKRMFKHMHQFAIVIDPVKFDMKAFILDWNAKKHIREAGYAIIDFSY
jgi:proteasome lid subunit RPN8/RPN11